MVGRFHPGPFQERQPPRHPVLQVGHHLPYPLDTAPSEPLHETSQLPLSQVEAASPSSWARLLEVFREMLVEAAELRVERPSLPALLRPRLRDPEQMRPTSLMRCILPPDGGSEGR